MFLSTARGALFLCLVLAFTRDALAGGNVTCATNALDWYTNAVGETPCTTYQRLRQQCDPDYVTPSFSSTPPGDTCNSQLKTCCCNSIAYALSMLCLNCQWDETANVNGYDAAAGTYGKYLAGCAPVSNNTIDPTVELAVCKESVDLRPWLYTTSWTTDGSWFYTYFREAASLQINAGETKNLTNCPQTSSSAGVPSITSSPASGSPSVDSNSHSSNSGAIAGGVIGGLALLALAGFGFWWFWRTQREERGLLSVEKRFGAEHMDNYSGAPVLMSGLQPNRYGAPQVFSPQSQVQTLYPASYDPPTHSQQSLRSPPPPLPPPLSAREEKRRLHIRNNHSTSTTVGSPEPQNPHLRPLLGGGDGPASSQGSLSYYNVSN